MFFLLLMEIFNFILVCCDTIQVYPWLEQISRQELLLSGCANMDLQNSVHFNITQFDHILVDHNHKLLYCYVPKIACTNWKRVLMVLGNRSNASQLMDIPASVAHANGSLVRLSELNQKDALYCLNNYFSFLMVRQPFERLLSAFRNKLEDNLPSAKYFQSRVGRYIIKKYRNNATDEDLKNGDNVTFREFIQYLILEGINNDYTNEHWKPIYQLCYPCLVNYSFIAKYENFEEDSNLIMDLIHAPPVLFPHSKPSGTSEKLKQYLQQLSLRDIESLYRLYEIDFRLFGYTLESILGFEIG